MTEETEEAFDLFSTSYVRVPKVTEAEKREAEKKRLEAAIRMRDFDVIREILQPHDAFVKDIQREIHDAVIYGSTHFFPVFRGLYHSSPVIEWKEIDPYPPIYRYEYREPHFGASPAAKPDQPRHWVAMNQAPKRARR